jgi:synaptic vesicle membrane protein VAT-1
MPRATGPQHPLGRTLTEVVLPGVVEPDGLIVRERPLPTPGRGQALVEMQATGVSFAETSMRRNRYPGQPKFPFVPGYDLVGVVRAVGAGVDQALLGRRVAAVTKTGGWSTHALLDARDLMPVGDDIDAATVEALLLNGITAWQMLHRKAPRVRSGQTILVHGASSGVGLILVQLALLDDVRVIATASQRHHELLRELGAIPLDYHAPDLIDRVRQLTPQGVDAAFDNLGGASFKHSFGRLAPGGMLVGYGTASQRDDTDNQILTFFGILAQFGFWNVALNRGRRATFYNFWGGKIIRPKRFRERLSADLNPVLAHARTGKLTPYVAARIPLAQASRALVLAESRTTQGKIVITP